MAIAAGKIEERKFLQVIRKKKKVIPEKRIRLWWSEYGNGQGHAVRISRKVATDS
jgi:hypothetical protein